MFFLILLLALPVFAQGIAPEWVNESWRSSHYPKAEWYTGFEMDKVKEEPDSKAYQAVEKNAQNRLSESIVITVQGSSSIQTSAKQTEKGETISKNFDKSIKIASNTVLANMEVKHYFDKKTGYIYGFAAVKKKDLADFYKSNINNLFSFAEKELSLAEQFTEAQKIKTVEDSLKKVSFWGSMLRAVENDNSYTEREMELWKRLNYAKTSFQSGSGIFLQDTVKDSNPLAAELTKVLSQKVALSKGVCTLGITAAVESDKKPSCSDSMVGVICVANTQLIIAQCKDGKKTILKGSIVGADKNSEEMATKQIFRKIESADFWGEWIKELEKRSKQ